MKTIATFVMIFACSLILCSASCNRSRDSATAVSPPNATVVSTIEQESQKPASADEPTPDKESPGYLAKLKGLYESAKATGMSSAAAAQDMLGESYSQAMDVGGATLSQTAEWATGAYQTLKDQGLTTAKNSAEWLMSEMDRAKQWEYRVMTIESNSPGEKLEAALAELGKEKWECFHIQATGDQLQLVCKRQPQTYLSKIPATDLLGVMNLLKQKK